MFSPISSVMHKIVFHSIDAMQSCVHNPFHQSDVKQGTVEAA